MLESINQSINQYKLPGEIEQLKNVESLPPTETTDGAREALLSWGLSSEQIENLRFFASQFRYDLCPDKIERLSNKKPVLVKKEVGDKIVLKEFFDSDGRMDGQCGDIALQWLIQINESGLLKEINEGLPEKEKIVTCFHNGLSDTHFCRQGMNHVWNGLAIVDEKGFVKDRIYIDSAFQRIMTPEESGYTELGATYNAQKITAKRDLELEVEEAEVTETEFYFKPISSGVLGVTDDFKYSLCISFTRSPETQQINPLVSCIDAEGYSTKFMRSTTTKELLSSQPQNYNPIQLSNIMEVLDYAEKIVENLSEDPLYNVASWNWALK